MLIRLNNGRILNVVDKCHIVKNGKLYNVVTKEYEGVEGDEVSFCVSTTSGGICWVFGTVEGYTCSRRIVMKGSKTPYAIKEGTSKEIKHKSRIIETDGIIDNEEEVEEESDWAIVLKA